MYVLQTKDKISKELIDKLIMLDESISILDDNILLQEHCYGNEKAVKFNYEIQVFELNKLTDEDILKIIDKYKSENGTYFYQGIQYSYDELMVVLKKKLFTMKIYIKYKIIYDKNNLCLLDPWGFYERTRKKKKKKSLKKKKRKN